MVSPDLIHGWLAARSIARAVPPPVPDSGGWRVDTGSADETCRYVFAAPSVSITALSRRVGGPGIPIKLCASADVLKALVAPPWQIGTPAWMMEGAPATMPSLLTNYRLEVTGDRHRCRVSIVTEDGDVAASGYGATALGVFAYDRIATAAGHRRRGLGRRVMAALGGLAPADARHVLVATAMGRELYASIGWHVVSPYTTAVIPAGA